VVRAALLGTAALAAPLAACRALAVPAGLVARPEAAGAPEPVGQAAVEEALSACRTIPERYAQRV
jgi:hypothetical protein